MKIYLASRYSRRLELCGYRDTLHAMGHEVTSRWLNGSHQISNSGAPIGDHGERLVEGDDGSTNVAAAELRQSFAAEDIEDVEAADCIINFTETPRSGHSRGGRHVEFGYALAIFERSSIIVIGYRENLFHWLDGIRFYETWQECLGSFFANIAEGAAP